MKNTRALVKLARFLLTRADNRGLTHGEKHYLIQTALNLLAQAQDELEGNQYPTAGNEVTTASISGIPF